MKKTTYSKKSLALALTLVMLLSMLSIFSVAAADYEWWDLRGYEESAYNSAVASTSSPFAGWRDLVGTYGAGGPQLSVRHYWGWYAETPNSTRQRIDIYVPSHATKNSPILHMVNNSGWTSNAYPFNAPAYNATTQVFTPGNNTSANALNRGYVVMTNGARTYGTSLSGADYGKSPATMADYKAALRFLRANMGPDKAITVGNPDLVFVTGTSGGGAMSNILGASGDSPDYFATMYEIGALGLEWNSATPYSAATLYQKTDMVNWTDTLSDAYMGVAAWCPMDDFAMGEQGMAWFFAEKRWAQASDAAKTPALMTATNRLALEFIDYINALGLEDEYGQMLSATYTVKNLPEEGGAAGGSFLDATIRLMEKGLERAITNWALGEETDFDAATFAVTDALTNLYANSLINDSVLVNGMKPSESIQGVPAGSLPVNPTVEITNYVNYLLGLSPSLAKGSIFPYSSPGAGPSSGVAPFEPDSWVVMADTSGMYGTNDQPNNVLNREAWNSFVGPAASYPGAGMANSGGQTWDEYLQTPDGQAHALQLKMASSIPYLNADNLAAVPYLNDAGIYGSDIANPAKYWFVRYGMNDQQITYAMLTTVYYSLLNNDAVDFDMCEVIPFNWNKPHQGGYENIFRWIDSVVDVYNHTVISTDASASVEKLNGNKNNLTVTVADVLMNGEIVLYVEKISINNNAAGTYQVGPYKVYVDTKGNTQIRACYIVG